jgi:hypothetical protein
VIKMTKYLLLKHYRGAPASVNDVPMDQWTPEEFSAHVQYMEDFAARLASTGEVVDRRGRGARGLPLGLPRREVRELPMTCEARTRAATRMCRWRRRRERPLGQAP